MALDKELLYKSIYNDLARKKNLVAGVEVNGDAVLGADWQVMDSSDTNHKRGMINETVVDTADGDGTRLVIDLIASTVADRVVGHILGYPDLPNSDVLPNGEGGGYPDPYSNDLHTGLRTTGAEAQIIALKDHVNTLTERVDQAFIGLKNLSAKNQSLLTELATVTTNTALTNTNILTMIQAWQILNVGLSAPDPSGSGATAAAAVAVFESTMASLVTSWTTIATQHTTFATTKVAQLTTEFASLDASLEQIQGLLDSMMTEADTIFIAGSAVTVE